MKINWDVKITSFEGADFTDREGRPTPLTLRSCVFQALDQDAELKPEDKLDRWELQMAVKIGGDIDKTQLKLIKEKLKKSTYTPWIVGTCIALLNEGEQTDKVNIANDLPRKNENSNVTEHVKAS